MALSELIKYEGDNSTFIWKYPHEDFNNMTELIVHESQEAIFFANGQAADTFGPGRYKLDAENIPILTKLINVVTGVSIFHCEVYFINKTVQMAIKWGTDSKVRFIEPTLKDCVAGDLALVMPHRIITNILEGLETLDKIIPGVNNDDTLLYGPEIKFFSNEIETDNKFKLQNSNIYFIGDGAGKAGNIVTASATGLVAARDIIERIKDVR